MHRRINKHGSGWTRFVVPPPIRETEKAYLFTGAQLGIREADKQVWLPKSKVEMKSANTSGHFILYIPLWLVDQHGLDQIPPATPGMTSGGNSREQSERGGDE